jgi:hypothetical protein
LVISAADDEDAELADEDEETVESLDDELDAPEPAASAASLGAVSHATSNVKTAKTGNMRWIIYTLP